MFLSNWFFKWNLLIGVEFCGQPNKIVGVPIALIYYIGNNAVVLLCRRNQVKPIPENLLNLLK